MAPFVAMVVGSVVRHVVTAVGAGMVGAGAMGEAAQAQTLPVDNDWAMAIGALMAAGAQIWSLWQKHKVAPAPVQS